MRLIAILFFSFVFISCTPSDGSGLPLTATLVFLLLPSIITGFIAKRKGKSFWMWVFYGFLICLGASLFWLKLKSNIMYSPYSNDIQLLIYLLAGPITALSIKNEDKSKITLKKSEVKRQINNGIELYNIDKVEEALEVFEKIIAGGVNDKDKGLILYNIATCNVRLGRKEAAIDALDKAISALPKLGPKIKRDTDFNELKGPESFQKLKEKYKGNFVRTGRWYLAWGILFAIIGYATSINTGREPVYEAGKFVGMSFWLAWIVGNNTEKIFEMIKRSHK